MKIAVFSDVHGNLTAMQAVLDDIGQQAGLDAVIFAGDLCFFGPRPQACVDLLRRHQVSSLVGNTDEWIRRPPPPERHLPAAVLEGRRHLQEISAWTASRLDAGALAWIDELRGRFEQRFSPTSVPADDVLVVHANPVDLMRIIFPPVEQQMALYHAVRQPDDELEQLLDGAEFGAMAFGHLHIPSVRNWRGRPLINAGSVSMPGDDDPRAKYAVIQWNEHQGWTADHVFVPYEVEAEVAAFRRTRPPNWEECVRTLESVGYVAQRV
jgi:predicted phosphodiesterase